MIGTLLKSVFSAWWQDNAPRLGAALAFYTLFSLSPLLIIAVGVAGLIFGREAAQGHIIAQIEGLVGHDGAIAVQALIESARKPASGIMATLFGLFTLLVGATGLFGELQASLNTIWEVPDQPGTGVVGILKTRFLSFTMVLGMGFLLLVSLVVSAALAAAGHSLSGIFPKVALLGLVVNFLVSILVTTLLFAMIYKYLPNVTIAWSDVWIGAAVTALLVHGGKVPHRTLSGNKWNGLRLRCSQLARDYSYMGLLLGADFSLGGRVHPDLFHSLGVSVRLPFPTTHCGSRKGVSCHSTCL